MFTHENVDNIEKKNMGEKSHPGSATQSYLLNIFLYILQNYDDMKKYYIVNKMHKLHFYFHSMYFKSSQTCSKCS